MRVLVTGAAGFIGRHVARHLAIAGHDVCALVRQREQACVAGLSDLTRVVACDLSDRAAIHAAIAKVKPEVAVHLAWYAVPKSFWRAPQNLDSAAMTLELVRALAEAGCHRIVAAGTCAEYDWSHRVLHEERTPLAPRTLYGKVKLATKIMLEAFCAETGLSFAWLRFFWLYGPGEAEGRLVPSVVIPLLRGEAPTCTSGQQRRDFLYVEDAAGAVAAITASQATGAVNIASGESLTVREAVEQLAASLGAPGRVAFGSLPDDPAEPRDLVADITKLRKETSWKPEFSLREGLARTAEWWRTTLAPAR